MGRGCTIPEQSRATSHLGDRCHILLISVFFVFASSQFAITETNVSIEKGSDADSISLGQKLFRQDFGEYNGFFLGGDGLGPMFNARSCVECHHQGGEGGGGGLTHNVDIITVTDRTLEQVPKGELTKVHSGFMDRGGEFIPAIVLHRFSTDPRYSSVRRSLLGKSWIQIEDDERAIANLLRRSPCRLLRPNDLTYLVHSQRNTPAIFGIGLIDQVSDELIVGQANRKKRFGIRGRISQIANDQIGRFGWRAQLPSLEEFVLSACANELGLEVEAHSQTANPLDSLSRLSSAEVSKTDTDAMIEHVASIDQPLIDYSHGNYDQVVAGLRAFEEIGCAECHVRHMGVAREIFSDLLLHDMGDYLSDPLGASPEIETVTIPNPKGEGTRTFFEPPKTVNVYYVGTMLTQEVRTEPNRDDPFTDVLQRFAKTNIDRRQEWRTPPLWGCADSAPYMHDGRSTTLHESIKAHAGEATKVRSNYTALKTIERENLIAFLMSLRAPDVNH